MKTEEDEAFEEIERRQGGGFPAKRAMAADKLQEPVMEREALKLAFNALQLVSIEWVCNGAHHAKKDRHELGESCPIVERYQEAITAIKAALAQPVQQEALYGMNQDDWKDVVAAITKVRDGRGIYLGCRPADVFQEWFLALGTAKVKEKNT